jgi:sarcosine oxidase/sarcosine oxidase subunit beta
MNVHAPKPPRGGRALVVGGGIYGLSTAWALRRRGFAVDLFEQGPLPNPRASSYDEHRITRHAYGTLEGYAFLMPRAFAAWEALFRDIGSRHLHESSVVYFLREDTPWHDATCRSLAALGVGFRDVPLAEVPDRFPMMETAGLTRAVETERGGILFPIRIMTDLVVALARDGVRLHGDTRVAAIDPETATVITATGERHRGDAVAIAAGAWVNNLVPGQAGRLAPSRQAVMFLAPPPELARAWGEAPVLIDLGLTSGTYTLPPRPGTRLKVGDHEFTRAGDADGDRLATDADVARLLSAAAQGYRRFERYSVLERKICFYTVTADERFVVEPWGGKAWVVSACSGHGFKLGPLIGEGVAAAIAGEIGPEDATRWAAGLMPLEESAGFVAA